MSFQKGVQNRNAEDSFTEDEVYRIWEWYFGKRWSINHIAAEFHVEPIKVIRAIDNESARRSRHEKTLKIVQRPLTTHPTAKINAVAKKQARKMKGKAAS